MSMRWLLAGSLATLMLAPLVGGEAMPLSAIVFPGPDNPSSVIFWDIRLPRACLAWVAGAALSASGMAFQALFRNGLATPFTLGVSSGAALGASAAIRLGFSAALLGFSAVSLSAMLGALLAVAVVYGVTRLKRDFSTGAMLLAGVAVNFFFSSLVLLVQYSAGFYDTFRIIRWLMGGLSMVGFGGVWGLLPFAVLGLGVLGFLVNELNLLTLGDDLAASRGAPVGQVKVWLFFAVSLMVGGVVALCGPIGFVGLMCPHICRLLVGPDHRRLLPASILFGGAFLVLCDTAARSVFSPAELPVGVLTSLLGGPFFLWLLARPGYSRRVAP